MPALGGILLGVGAIAGAFKKSPSAPDFSPYAGLNSAQKDKKIAAESKLADIQAVIDNRQLDIATSQAEALNANTRAGGWLKIAASIGVAVILFLILRKKKIIEI